MVSPTLSGVSPACYLLASWTIALRLPIRADPPMAAKRFGASVPLISPMADLASHGPRSYRLEIIATCSIYLSTWSATSLVFLRNHGRLIHRQYLISLYPQRIS